MPLKLNGVDIDKMYLNGTEVDTGYLNGVEVFSAFNPNAMMYWSNANYIVQFDTEKMKVNNVLPVEKQSAIEIGTDGYLYASGVLNGQRSILRINPETMAVTSSYIPPGIVISRDGLMVGPQNTVYFSGYPLGDNNIYLYRCKVIGDNYYLTTPDDAIYGTTLSKGMMYSKSNDRIYTTFGNDNISLEIQRCNYSLKREVWLNNVRTNGDRPVDVGSSLHLYSSSLNQGEIWKIEKNTNQYYSVPIQWVNRIDSIISDQENRDYLYACCYNSPIMNNTPGSNVVKITLVNNSIVARSTNLTSAQYLVDTRDGYLCCIDVDKKELVKLRKIDLVVVDKKQIEDIYLPYLIYSNNSAPGYNIQAQI